MNPEWPKNINTPKPTENIVEVESEQRLSPEMIEGLMKKLQDINMDGTAFSVINNRAVDGGNKGELISYAFKLGLIEGFDNLLYERKTLDKDTLSNYLREKKRRPVYFNIIGRGYDFENFNESTYMKRKNALAIIFDISSFKERKEPVYDAYDSRKFKGLELKEYAADIGARGELVRFEDDKLKVASGHGFVITPRISPRFFRGIVIKNGSTENAQEIVSGIMNSGKNPESYLVPIYDESGNLLWPKQIPYEEVKKLIEERNRNKEEK